MLEAVLVPIFVASYASQLPLSSVECRSVRFTEYHLACSEAKSASANQSALVDVLVCSSEESGN